MPMTAPPTGSEMGARSAPLVPNLPNIVPEQWTALLAKKPKSLTKAEWRELMLVKAELAAKRHVPSDRLKSAETLAANAGATATAKEFDQARLNALMLEATPSGKAAMAAQPKVVFVTPAKHRQLMASTAPKAPAVATAPTPAPAPSKPVATATPAPAPAAASTPEKPEARAIASYRKVMTLLKEGKPATLDSMLAAKAVAQQIGHKKSAATLDRRIALARADVTPAHLQSYGRVVTALRSGKSPADQDFKIATSVASRLAASPAILGHVPSGIDGSTWARYLQILYGVSPNTSTTDLQFALDVAKKAGHGRIVKGLTQAVAKRQAPPASAAPVAKGPPAGVNEDEWRRYGATMAAISKGQRVPYEAIVRAAAVATRISDRTALGKLVAAKRKMRPYEPATLHPSVSDAEYATYVDVFNKLGKRGAIDGAKLESAKKTAQIYGHGETLKRIAAKEAQKAKPAALAIKVGPAVIEKAAAPAVAAGVLAAILPALRKHAGKPPKGIASSDWQKALMIASAARKKPDGVSDADLSFATQIFTKGGWKKSAESLAAIAKRRHQQPKAPTPASKAPLVAKAKAKTLPKITITPSGKPLPITEAEKAFFKTALAKINAGKSLSAADLRRAVAIAEKLQYQKTIADLKGLLAKAERQQKIVASPVVIARVPVAPSNSEKAAAAKQYKVPPKAIDAKLAAAKSNAAEREKLVAAAQARARLSEAQLAEYQRRAAAADAAAQDFMASAAAAEASAAALANRPPPIPPPPAAVAAVPVMPDPDAVMKLSSAYGTPASVSQTLLDEASKGGEVAQGRIERASEMLQRADAGSVADQQAIEAVAEEAKKGDTAALATGAALAAAGAATAAAALKKDEVESPPDELLDAAVAAGQTEEEKGLVPTSMRAQVAPGQGGGSGLALGLAAAGIGIIALISGGKGGAGGRRSGGGSHGGSGSHSGGGRKAA